MGAFHLIEKMSNTASLSSSGILAPFTEEEVKAGRDSDFKPLCFNKDTFDEDDFSVDQFLFDLRHRSLPLSSVLRDLRRYNSSLEAKLLELINQDYADFVSLSANLKGIDQTIDSLRVPVQSLHQEVASIRDSVTDEMSEVKEKMARKRQLEEKRQCLTLFLDVYQTICKIEALLRVGEADPIQFSASDEDTSNLIQRVANDFNQLKYYVSRTKDFPFVQNLGSRIDRIETTMQEGLETLFCDGLVAGDRDVITNCLRTYAAIDRTSDVQDLYQRKHVDPFLTTIVHSKVYEEKGLQAIYDQILQWIASDCQLLLELTHKSVRGFDFLTHSIFASLARLMITQCSDAFGAGFPHIFHANYLVSERFLNRFEEFFATSKEVQAFRASAVYIDFQKRWNVSIYFGLRYQAIAKTLEKSLQQAAKVNHPPTQAGFLLTQSQVLWDQLHECWNPEIFLPALTDSFFKLTLQLVTRYAHWITQTTSPSSTDHSSPRVEEEQYLFLFQDAEQVSSKMTSTYIQKIQSIQPHLHPQVLSILQDSYQHLEGLKQAMSQLGHRLCDKVIEQCLVALQPVKGIMQTYRITNKEPSNRPSFYVQNIFAPLHQFLQHTAVQQLAHPTRRDWCQYVATQVTNKYAEWSKEMLETAQKQNTILKKYVKAAKDTEGKSQGLRVDEKIAIQLSPDVEKYQEELCKLSVEPDQFAPLLTLRQSYQENLPQQ